ncbi:hypothetical protein DHEL01_v206728 [Diaporthe helianthi]|uniref:2EXR domain-containing protein n=1 Tax=Diaporthe helianthi TaxID=158607 RepID=A0A2P5HXA6_DIAHE|nr:hypothetical protein DHEL01_v206728 [Diaporthe helianthi]
MANFTADMFPEHVTEEDFNFAMGFTNESPLEKRLKEAAENFNRQYAALRQVDGLYDDNSSGRVFHVFPKLPAELQLEVWKHAVHGLTAPNVQAFDFDLAYDANAAPVGRAGNGVIACFKPKYTRALTGHRGLLMASVDSRKAFLEFADYTMQHLTYLVSPPAEKKEPEAFMEYIEKSNKSFDNMCIAYGHHLYNNGGDQAKRPPRKTAAPKPKNAVSQNDKTFAHVILPINFDETRFLIDTVADTLAYTTVHPTPPTIERVFTQAAGLELMHSIKKLAMSMNQVSFNTERIFSDFFAQGPQHWRCAPLPGPSHFTLGALEELTYVSAKAFRRQCCIGHAHVWANAPTIKLLTFQRGLRTASDTWAVKDLYQLHITLMDKWKRHDRNFNLRWMKAMKQRCTCRR